MSAFIPASLYGVIGWPLAQSLSPLLHNTAFQALGIPAAYMLWELPPEKLPQFVDSMRLLGIRGCSVTLPHKVEILPLLDHRSERVELMGAANTLYWRDGRLCGENTDVTGFMHPLLERGLDPATPVLVLGAGGAARAVVCGLWLHGCRRIFVTTPSDRSHAPLVERFGVTAVPWAERHDVAASLLVNTTPLGMHGKAEDRSPYDFDRAPAPADGGVPVAYDIVYNPLCTLFLRRPAAGPPSAVWRCFSARARPSSASGPGRTCRRPPVWPWNISWAPRAPESGGIPCARSSSSTASISTCSANVTPGITAMPPWPTSMRPCAGWPMNWAWRWRPSRPTTRA